MTDLSFLIIMLSYKTLTLHCYNLDMPWDIIEDIATQPCINAQFCLSEEEPCQQTRAVGQWSLHH